MKEFQWFTVISQFIKWCPKKPYVLKKSVWMCQCLNVWLSKSIISTLFCPVFEPGRYSTSCSMSRTNSACFECPSTSLLTSCRFSSRALNSCGLELKTSQTKQSEQLLKRLNVPFSPPPPVCVRVYDSQWRLTLRRVQTRRLTTSCVCRPFREKPSFFTTTSHLPDSELSAFVSVEDDCWYHQ